MFRTTVDQSEPLWPRCRAQPFGRERGRPQPPSVRLLFPHGVAVLNLVRHLREYPRDAYGRRERGSRQRGQRRRGGARSRVWPVIILVLVPVPVPVPVLASYSSHGRHGGPGGGLLSLQRGARLAGAGVAEPP